MTDSQVILAQRESSVLEAEAKEAEDLLGDFEIHSEIEQERAAGWLREVKSRIKVLEEKRTAITRPLNDALREVNALFRPAREHYEACERTLKGAISYYLSEREAVRRALLAEAARAATVVEAEQALARVEPVAAPPGSGHPWRLAATGWSPEHRHYPEWSPLDFREDRGWHRGRGRS